MKHKRKIKVSLPTGDTVTIKDYGDGVLVGGGLGGFMTEAEMNQAEINSLYAMDLVRTHLLRQAQVENNTANAKKPRGRKPSHGLTKEELSTIVCGLWGQSREILLESIKRRYGYTLTDDQLGRMITQTRKWEAETRAAFYK